MCARAWGARGVKLWVTEGKKRAKKTKYFQENEEIWPKYIRKIVTTCLSILLVVCNSKKNFRPRRAPTCRNFGHIDIQDLLLLATNRPFFGLFGAGNFASIEQSLWKHLFNFVFFSHGNGSSSIFFFFISEIGKFFLKTGLAAVTCSKDEFFFLLYVFF